MKILADKILSVFGPDEVLGVPDVVLRSFYGHSTVTCALASLAKQGRLWRVAHGRYSTSPRPSHALFTLEDKVLAAFRHFSFVSTAHVRRETGISAAQVSNIAARLVKAGKLNKVRRGLYAAREGVLSDWQRAVKGLDTPLPD